MLASLKLPSARHFDAVWRKAHTRLAEARTQTQRIRTWHPSRKFQQGSSRSVQFRPGYKLAATQQASNAAPATEKASHNAAQARSFDASVASEFLQPLDEDVVKKLQRIVEAVPDLDRRDVTLEENSSNLPFDSSPRLGPNSRVIDGGCGTGALIPLLQAQGVQDILAVDLSPAMLMGLRDRFPPPGQLGNIPGVRTWEGDVADLPGAQFQGASALFLNAVFGNVFDQRSVLLAAATKLPPTAHIVISHPLGREWLDRLHIESPETVPHVLPDQPTLERMIVDLPLSIVSFVDEADFYMVVLQIPRLYAFGEIESALASFDGEVLKGFGRGSSQLGFPTANLPPASAEGLPRGVYYGWAQLLPPRQDDSSDSSASSDESDLSDESDESDSSDVACEDHEVHPMVMNIGYRPTVEDEGEVTVELHVMHTFQGDFYGKRMRAAALGFLRPEVKFDGVGQLKAQIRADIGVAKSQLASWQSQQWKRPDNSCFGDLNAH